MAAEFGVYAVLRDRDIDAVEAWRDRLIGRLVGWQPDDGDQPIEYAGYALVDLTPGEGRWLFRFRAGWRIRK